jgi:hypothetical protein
VQATDPAGNVEPEPASYAWTVEEAPVLEPFTVVVSAGADAWIDKASSSSNKGNDSILKVQSKRNNDFRVLIRFELPPVPEGYVIESATLRLYSPSGTSNRTLQVRRIAASWTESGVTWANQPATSGAAATATSGTGWREWNVMAQLQAMYASGNYGFQIRDASENSSAGFEQQFHSREKGQDMPELVITFRPGG